MAITSLDTYISATKHLLVYTKTVSNTTVASAPFSMFDIAGSPGGGTLAVGNTTNGVIRTDATAGFPTVIDVGANTTPYISRVEFYNTVACRFRIYDCVWSAGAFNANTNGTVTLNTPPLVDRVVANNFAGLELWYECVTAVTGNQSIAITYRNQAGVDGKSTGTYASGVAPIVRRMFRIQLAAGDTGLMCVNTVVGTVSTAGTFNLHIMRPLWSGRVVAANFGENHDFLRTGMVKIFENSALFPVIWADSTAQGLPDIEIEVAHG